MAISFFSFILAALLWAGAALPHSPSGFPAARLSSAMQHVVSYRVTATLVSRQNSTATGTPTLWFDDVHLRVGPTIKVCQGRVWETRATCLADANSPYLADTSALNSVSTWRRVAQRSIHGQLCDVYAVTRTAEYMQNTGNGSPETTTVYLSHATGHPVEMVDILATASGSETTTVLWSSWKLSAPR